MLEFERAKGCLFATDGNNFSAQCCEFYESQETWGKKNLNCTTLLQKQTKKVEGLSRNKIDVFAASGITSELVNKE